MQNIHYWKLILHYLHRVQLLPAEKNANRYLCILVNLMMDHFNAL